jgi:dihydroorotate dehydrogenase
MYKKLLRPILFNIDPEKTHDLIFFLTGLIFKIPFSHFLISKFFCLKSPSLETELFGIKFPNPVGLAAGFDKMQSYTKSFHLLASVLLK